MDNVSRSLLAVGGAAAGDQTYIEDVFSTWLYTGNGSGNTIANGTNFVGIPGYLIWTKARSAATDHVLTASPNSNFISTGLSSNTTGQQNVSNGIISLQSNGYLLTNNANTNANGTTYASWTFRKQPKFFDVVTYTGNNTNNRQISHNLGSVPGCIIVKCTSSNGAWWVYHRSIGFSNSLFLNSTSGLSGTGIISATSSTTFTIPSATDGINDFGASYVAYLFAHDAGGFGLTGTDNVISCGSFTTNGSAGAAVSLGYEPQWVLIKASSSTSGWLLSDTMRGMSLTNFSWLFPNNSNAESANGYTGVYPTATGFNIQDGTLGASTTYIYIAIRRGPMKTPTTGTSVFKPVSRAGTASNATVTGVGFPPDLSISKSSDTSFSVSPAFFDKLRGPNIALQSGSTSAELTPTDSLLSFNQDGVSLGADGTLGFINFYAQYANWYFRRAPGFFDMVCYTGTGVSRQINISASFGNVLPELVIYKNRSSTSRDWIVWPGVITSANNYLVLNSTAAIASDSSIFPGGFDIGNIRAGTNNNINASGNSYVAYVFATLPGVSRVGSYTGNGSSQTINCGFTTGARFVLIKRTDSTGDWYVWDTARGIVAANDPHLSLNTLAAEVTTNDSIDPDNTGFIVNQVAATNINVSSATYIYLAIA